MIKTVGILLTLAVSTAACGGGGQKSDGSRLSGTISGDGSSTVFPISEAVAEEFQRAHPAVQVTVGEAGTGGGFKKFCNDETDVQDASRPIKDTEKQACAANAIEYVELSIAKDGLAVVVNKQNTWAKCLTTAELKKIWEPSSKISNWKDVKAGFPDKPLTLFGPDTDSGTFDYFTNEINGEEGASRTDYSPNTNDNTLVQGVAGAEGAFGYFGFAYYTQNRDKLNLVAIDGGSGCVSPSDETVESGTYVPLSRPLFLYVKKSSTVRPEVRAFIDFYLENVSALLKDVGYTPLAEDALKIERQEFESFVGASK